MDAQQRSELIQAALDARARAYAPYSNFAVGAALLAGDGRIFSGSNVENVSYGLTVCAERVAAATAVAAGQRRFGGLAIASAGAVTPCGACRQVLAEFCSSLPIVLVDANQPEAVVETTLESLLPERFS